MVMVEINSNAILVEPLKSRKYPELTRAYKSLMLRLKRTEIIPKKHILDNEVSKAIQNVIKEECDMEMELVPPGFHRRNTAEVAIRNFKAHRNVSRIPTVSVGQTIATSRDYGKLAEAI